MTGAYFYIAIAFFLAFLFGAVIILARAVRKKNREIKELSESVKRQNRSIGFLLRHSSELAETRREKDGLMRKIQEARSDEDISDIVGGIIELNNGRLPGGSKG